MDKIQQMFDAKELTYIFCVSTSMLKKKIEEVGKMADNLIEVYVSEHPKRLRFEVKKVKNAEFLRSELEAPFSQEILEKAEKRAKKFRVTEVPKIRKV